MTAAWSDGLHMIAELAEQTVNQLKKATAAAKGVGRIRSQHSGKTGIILVEGVVAANLKVVLKW